MYNSALITDLYELTMAASYFEHGFNPEATFSLFVRDYADHRRFFVSAGLEDVVEYLENFHFTEPEIDYLHSLGLFKDDFLDYLARMTFSGQAAALPEGRIFFVNEPVIEITGSLLEAQIFETFVINAVNIQTMIASKAARVVQAGQGRRRWSISPCAEPRARRPGSRSPGPVTSPGSPEHPTCRPVRSTAFRWSEPWPTPM